MDFLVNNYQQLNICDDFSVQRYDFLMKNANISEYFELFCAIICIIEKLFVTLCAEWTKWIKE